MHLHIIATDEIVASIFEYVKDLVEKEENWNSVSHTKKVYWKDTSMQDMSFEIDAQKPISQEEWVALFDKHLVHNAMYRNDADLEICHYSEMGNRNDPFVVVYIPQKEIKE